MIKVNFNEPSIVGKELEYINKAILNGHISGNGHFTKLSERYLSHFFSSNALLAFFHKMQNNNLQHRLIASHIYCISNKVMSLAQNYGFRNVNTILT